MYDNIKPTLKQVTGNVKYTASVYAMYKNPEGEFEMVNFHFSKSALNAWIELKKQANVMKEAVVIKSYKEAVSGTITYRYPTFTTTKVLPETNDQALTMDKILQEHFIKYKEIRGVKAAPEPSPENTGGATETDITDTGEPVTSPALDPEQGDDLPF